MWLGGGMGKRWWGGIRVRDEGAGGGEGGEGGK